MFQYSGRLGKKGGAVGDSEANAMAELAASISPPMLEIRIADIAQQSAHSVINERFSFQSRDSLSDLVSRAPWVPHWSGR